MKNILTRDLDLFRTDVYRMTSSVLKNLNKAMYLYAKSNFHNYKGKDDLRHDMILDFERKQTVIVKELQRRKVITNENIEDYHTWLYGSHNRRVF